MIALVTSTISPADNTHSFFNEAERYSQTIKTIKKLLEKGFSEIYMFDNSSKSFDQEKLNEDSGCFVNFIHNRQYTFANKGINEALLILNNLDILPKDQPIFKISGRYYLAAQFNLEIWESFAVDFMGRGYNFKKKNGLFSTRGYFVKNKEILEKMLVLAVEDMLAYGKGIYGIRSAIKQLKSLTAIHPGSAFQISIEHAFARILKTHFKYQLLDRIGIEGCIAGSPVLDLISE